MKQYENKKLSLLATEIDENNYEVNGNPIPKLIIEGATDWVEIPKIEVVFISIDGVEVKSGSEVWCVGLDWRITQATANTYYPIPKFYSARPLAEQYVLENKPCLSISDVKNVLAYKRGEKNKSDIEVLYAKFKKLSDEKVLQNL